MKNCFTGLIEGMFEVFGVFMAVKGRRGGSIVVVVGFVDQYEVENGSIDFNVGSSLVSRLIKSEGGELVLVGANLPIIISIR